MTGTAASPRTARPNPFAPRSYGELQQVTPRVWIYRNITNSSFVVGDRSVAVIDTQVNYPTAEAVLRAVRSVTDKPIRYVVNTHYHWDHTNGNALFRAMGAVIVASEATREFMVTRHDRQKEFLSGRGFELGRDPLLPQLTFRGECGIDLGGCDLRLFHAGSAETDDATAVHVPGENVIMSGDTVMTGSFPIFGQPVWDEGLQGDGAWQRTIANLIALKPQTILPGHGPLAGHDEIRLLLDIQNYFVQEVGSRVKKGMGLSQILMDLEPRLPKWITSLPVVWGTPRYAILRVWRGLTRQPGEGVEGQQGWQSFKPSALPQPDPMSIAKISVKETFADFLKMAEEAAEGGDGALKLEILNRAAAIFAHLPDAWAAYAEALIENSRAEASVLEKGDFFAPARAAWNRALALDPQHAGALLGKGRYLVMMAFRGGDDPKEGMALLEKVAAMKTGGRMEAEAWFYLGIGYRRLGDETKAKELFQRAIQLDPVFMPARLALEA